MCTGPRWSARNRDSRRSQRREEREDGAIEHRVRHFALEARRRRRKGARQLGGHSPRADRPVEEADQRLGEGGVDVLHAGSRGRIAAVPGERRGSRGPLAREERAEERDRPRAGGCPPPTTQPSGRSASSAGSGQRRLPRRDRPLQEGHGGARKQAEQRAGGRRARASVPSMARPGSWAESAAWLRGVPPKAMPETFTKLATARAPIIANAGAARLAQTQGSAEPAAAARSSPTYSSQLAREPVEGRRSADGDGSDAEERERARHGSAQAAEGRELRGAGGVEHAAGGEEEQRLHQAVIEHVEERSSEAQDHEIRAAERAADRREADTDHDDPDVLDAAVGEEPLQILLSHRPGDAEHSGTAHRPRAGYRPTRREESAAGRTPAPRRRPPP